MTSTRRVIYSVATSLDGFVARSDGAVDWLFTDGDYGFDSFMESIDTVLMGRRTYDRVLELSAGHPWPYAGKKGYVFSRTRGGSRDERVRFLDDEPADVVAQLREAPGSDLWLVGGGALAHAFLRDDLIDALNVAIHPIALGRGIPLFDGEAIERRFDLRQVHQHPNGLLQCEYVRTQPAAPPQDEDPSVNALWQTYLRHAGQDPATTEWSYVADAFADTPELRDELVNLVAAGRKRATASSVMELEAAGQPLPKVGDHLVVLDSRGVARCVVRTTKITIRPFEDVPPSFAAREGEGDGSLEFWKREHWAYFERVLATFGLAPSPTMDIVCEEFEMVYGPEQMLGGLVDDD